jgi:hypothetical protein
MKNEIAGKEEQLVALHSAAARQGRAMNDGQDNQAADSFAAVKKNKIVCVYDDERVTLVVVVP